jgi:hypothetical protein
MAGSKGWELMVRADDGVLVHVSAQWESPLKLVTTTFKQQ